MTCERDMQIILLKQKVSAYEEAIRTVWDEAASHDEGAIAEFLMGVINSLSMTTEKLARIENIIK